MWIRRGAVETMVAAVEVGDGSEKGESSRVCGWIWMPYLIRSSARRGEKDV
jgi:hypothetical protein